ncbi:MULTISPECIES: tRNA (adenosine(37)-N6)-threonylcarbamoyltransferase complex dimerization subunit type 1 TsaB [Methylobacterium]|uniref:tRNA (Adenosine(37)-N6)-threonylcarbamoyltransferase complex dimerization subunit type 1 TsaB n=1 Tax=Methylobacterium longum TaxID=767694 RepID=A0ABT8ANP4_9HYPH|nr:MULTISPECIES: tRNA (adenosine(37)-N6)-threonylcarbamoyltransferase complex dimerization subunit type 1 TsaB [Methylobacterium]MCJ2098135.1 tRNA (adenosine(37)-N6)-threonylcarbamoyltransferase complex dimerization subunit type 1 TsaB [Methylobacterium sp. E-046]MDN3571507.1 tRNA (adenosine(37)-N6)-threonylcarbamoyltransferase complex dimerization subunit type 1 TsaB [Methylobacterium longum]GJE12514.1 tRNA threonylcarbamoyladenosine biosynthesis protein TsaB [Methylobacterium longum]
MRILAIDTALDTCAACVTTEDSEAPLSAEALPMARGHAESLLPLIERVIARVEGGFEAIDRVAVTVGPGSYTGLRVGLSAARAIGLSTGKPVVGVGTLSALLAPLLTETAEGMIAAVIDARHGAVYVQALGAGDGLAPAHLAVEAAAERLGTGPILLTGSGAPLLAAALAERGIDAKIAGIAGPDIASVASLGLLADPAQALPRPLYLRGPDARPQGHARIARQ